MVAAGREKREQGRRKEGWGATLLQFVLCESKLVFLSGEINIIFRSRSAKSP